MSMSVGGDKQEVMVDINTTPLIDVMLVLLVTLIMSLPIQTHAVKLDMPVNQPPTPDQPIVTPEIIQLDIDFDGKVFWNGNEVDSLRTLDGYFKQESEKDPQPEIHLQPDKRAHYDIVAKVLASAQRNHMVKIGFVNTMEFATE
ncbi:MAG: biopolymer transporter ExbD [Gammaproteobacteria bacterium]|nr:biopolymer transporter ExbD [Gammaproteobacteria bacterium]